MKRNVLFKSILLAAVFTVFAVSAWAKTVTLSWDASPSAISGYKIYYAAGSSAEPLEGSGATEGASPINVGNVLTYTLNGLPDGEDHYFAVTAYDGSGNESTYSNTVMSAAVEVNQPPVLASIGNKSILEGANLSFTISATDGNGDSLQYSASGVPSGAGFNTSTATFSWTPTTDQSGTYSVTFQASDGTETDSETIVITVTDVNQAPVFNPIGSKTVAEGNELAFSVNAGDADGNILNYSASGLPAGATFSATTHAFSWIPGSDQAGSYSVTFQVSDGTATDTETVAITVTDVNQPPVLAAIGTKSVAEGSLLSFTISAGDPDGDALIYSVSGLPDGASFNATTRSFSWTPAYDTSVNTRVYPVTFVVSDGQVQDSETVTINVTHVNRAPVLATIGTQSLAEGDVFNLIVNASDPDNDSLTYSAANLPAGAVFTPATRSFSWIPASDQAGTYQVGFSVADGELSDSETVTFSVANGNEAPVLSSIGARSVVENALLSFTVSADDPNGDTLQYSATGLPEGAVFDSGQRQFNWTPGYSQAGSFSVVFSVSDGTYTDSETVAITVTNSNQAPVISGTPAGSVMATSSYTFTPSASDADGDSLTFSVTGLPSWASFSSTTGTLSGTPSEAQIGTYANIGISVSDGIASASLGPFRIEVIAYVYQDSDGDGVPDNEDPFPDDGSEWLDTDGDLIGNNSDPDDDNDGVADIRDGFPLDAGQAGWIITATAGTGGYISPEGNTSVLYGGGQSYQLTAMAGYYINDLLVDGISVGLADSYAFTAVAGHHTIEAVFSQIPNGLSHDPLTPGLVGVERVDAGDDSNNLVEGLPKQDLDFRFEIVFREDIMASQRVVYLVLNDFKYAMALTEGALANGALYTFETRLGPVNEHRFYFVAEDSSGSRLWRYPQDGDLAGPTIELLNGRNVVGIAANINAYALDSLEAFSDKQVYRWIADSGPNGAFKLADSGAPISSGEGYVLKRAGGSSLPDLSVYGELAGATYDIPLKAGWNLISNPYGGTVALADTAIRIDNGTAIDWLSAVSQNLVVDVVYSYLGEDWDDANEFSSAAGSSPALLVPWIGYWIYVNPSDQGLSLQIPRPLQ